MAQTWSPPLGSHGYSNVKPPGEGWTLTGYKSAQVQSNNPRMGSGKRTIQVPIYSRIEQAAPPPPPPPSPAPAPTPPPAPQPNTAIQQYRQEAADYMAKADAMLNRFRIDQQNAEQSRAAEQARMAEAQALQEKMRIQSQATLSANMARSDMQPNLQIAPASQAPQTAGTQAFKRRRSMRADMTSLSQGGFSALNIQQPSMLNV